MQLTDQNNVVISVGVLVTNCRAWNRDEFIGIVIECQEDNICYVIYSDGKIRNRWPGDDDAVCNPESIRV